ncbi:MAG: hypothetical protein QMD94_04710 [Candidatus Omnitrophota bacterium]|nr:hypothetical protein [Candidatus Omnitrophota bacterium]
MEVKLLRTALFFVLFLALELVVYAADPKDKGFIDFINDTTNGLSFEQAIAIDNICDYSQCRTRSCALSVFNRTVFGQEIQYITNKFGTRGKDWEVIDEDEVETDTFVRDKYYDDLGIELFATSEKKVLHFDITGPINALDEKFGSFVINLNLE